MLVSPKAALVLLLVLSLVPVRVVFDGLDRERVAGKGEDAREKRDAEKNEDAEKPDFKNRIHL